MQISVNPSPDQPATRIAVGVKPYDTIRQVKKRVRAISRSERRVSQKRGEPESRVKLIYACQPLDENRTVADYGIEDKCPISLVRMCNTDGLQIFVKIFGIGPGRGALEIKTIALDIELSDSIDSVKARIHDSEGIPTAAMDCLVFSGKRLENGRTLHEHGVCNFCMINLVLDYIEGSRLQQVGTIALSN